MQTGDFTSAINTFSSLIEYLPDETSYYLSLGKAYRSADKLMESVHVLENALKRDSLNIKTLLNLSHTYAMLDWDKKALQLLLKAREEAPYFEEIDLNLSVLYWKTGEKEKAAKILRNLNSKKTRLRKKVLNNLGNILLASGETRDAIKMYMDAEKLGGKDEEIYYNLALAYLERGKYGKAVDILKQLLRLSPERNDIILKTAELSAMTGDTANAKLMYHKLLKRSPYNKDVIRNLSELYIDMEEYEEAVEVLESYLKAYPQDNEFKLWLPEIYYTMGWYEVALTKYEEIMKEEIYHNSPKVHLGIGKNLAAKVLNNQSADVEKAFKYLKKAAALNPSDPTPLYHLGLLYRNVRGDKEKARKAWKKALGLSVGDSGDRGNSMYRKLKKLLREID